MKPLVTSINTEDRLVQMTFTGSLYALIVARIQTLPLAE